MDHRRHSATGESLYLVLGIPKTSTIDDIKKSYRRLALTHHPDKTEDPEKAEKFKEISKAYAVLSDSSKRNIYDNYGSMGLYIAEQFGEDNANAYFMLQSKTAKFCFAFLSIITGCFCCCCCCCCCNFCCGRMRPKQPSPDGDPDYMNLHEEKEREQRPTGDPIVAQPVSSTNKSTESSPLKESSQVNYN